MKLSIVIGPEKKEDLFIALLSERSFHFVNNETDAYMFHLENGDVDSYIIDGSDKGPESLNKMIESIHFLNALVTIIILVQEHKGNIILENRKNVFLVKDQQAIFDCLKSVPQNHRRHHRVKWPVGVVFWDPKNGHRHSGNLISISCSGCFIRTDEEYNPETVLALNIKFKEFNLRTNGRVVRVQTQGNQEQRGIALEFQDLTIQTSTCIQSIINEKILSDIMGKIAFKTAVGGF